MVTPDLLRKFPSLRPLPDETLFQLAQQSSIRKFARRGVVLNAGVREEFICFLFEGRLQGVDFTIDGREVGLYFVEPGEFCGELPLFDRGPQPEYVLALTAAMVVFVPMDSLREVMLGNPGLVNLFGEKLATRVRQMTRQRSLLALPNVGQRVCCQLWFLVPDQNANPLQGAMISNPPTHMEIAIMLNLSRESVTRVFQTLQAREIVKRDGPALLIINKLQELKDYAEGKREL